MLNQRDLGNVRRGAPLAADLLAAHWGHPDAQWCPVVGTVKLHPSVLQHPPNRIQIVGVRDAPTTLKIEDRACGYLGFASQQSLRPIEPRACGSALFGGHARIIATL